MDLAEKGSDPKFSDQQGGALHLATTSRGRPMQTRPRGDLLEIRRRMLDKVGAGHHTHDQQLLQGDPRQCSSFHDAGEALL